MNHGGLKSELFVTFPYDRQFDIHLRSSVVDDPSLSLFTPESLKQAEDLGELDVDSNILGLKPDPVFFVRFVKALGRPDVSSDLFLKLLERYRELRGLSETDPLRYLSLTYGLIPPADCTEGRFYIYNWYYRCKKGRSTIPPTS